MTTFKLLTELLGFLKQVSVNIKNIIEIGWLENKFYIELKDKSYVMVLQLSQFNNSPKLLKDSELLHDKMKKAFDYLVKTYEGFISNPSEYLEELQTNIDFDTCQNPFCQVLNFKNAKMDNVIDRDFYCRHCPLWDEEHSNSEMVSCMNEPNWHEFSCLIGDIQSPHTLSKNSITIIQSCKDHLEYVKSKYATYKYKTFY